LYYEWRAAAFSRRRDSQQAIADYTSLISLEPKNARAYYERSRLFDYIGDEARSRRDYEAAFRLWPEGGATSQFRVFLIQDLLAQEPAQFEFELAPPH
jgi:Tfp pilus assembly protein PilF